jgi:hypothetical protein
LQNARKQGLGELRVIVGKGALFLPIFLAKIAPDISHPLSRATLPSLSSSTAGNHSASRVAKIKPAIEDLMQRQRLTAHLDVNNSGVLVVHLQGQGGKGSREIISDLERDDNNDCVIM